MLRSAGFNNVDLKVAKELNIKVAYVPIYSPNSIAEHAVGLICALNRKIHKTYLRVLEDNFSIEGLVGRTIYDKKVGLIGYGHIGSIFAKIMKWIWIKNYGLWPIYTKRYAFTFIC